MKRKTIFITWIIIAIVVLLIFLARTASYVDEVKAREIALDIISRYYSTECGGNFEKYLKLDTINPLHVSAIDGEGYTFTSDNGNCNIFVYVYAYWWWFQVWLMPNDR